MREEMNDEEIKYMEKIIKDNKNENILELTFEEIERKKKEILKEIYLPKVELKIYLNKLKKYRYIDELSEVKEGNFYRWININNTKNKNDIKLANGGLLCEIKLEDNPILIFKNFMNKFFQINFNESLLFKKLSLQEEIILSAINYINK